MSQLQKVIVPQESGMPPVFLQWQCSERKAMFEALSRGEQPRFLASHLPVVSTLNGHVGAFPIHSSTKGVGLLPTSRYMDEHVAEIDSCLERSRALKPSDSLSDRIETTLSLYNRPDRIDTCVFGGIEIFRGQTYGNLQRDPRASLLFTGFGPKYISYQFNCDVEIVKADDPRFRFLKGMRLLFDSERFHITQPEYPLGYLFHVREVFDKTPHRVDPTRRLCPIPHHGGSNDA